LTFWVLPVSPFLTMVAVLKTKGTRGWPRKLAVTGAVLCTICTLLAACTLLWLVGLSVLKGSWSF
jgi:hypothetical protein